MEMCCSDIKRQRSEKNRGAVRQVNGSSSERLPSFILMAVYLLISNSTAIFIRPVIADCKFQNDPILVNRLAGTF